MSFKSAREQDQRGVSGRPPVRAGDRDLEDALPPAEHSQPSRGGAIAPGHFQRDGGPHASHRQPADGWLDPDRRP